MNASSYPEPSGEIRRLQARLRIFSDSTRAFAEATTDFDQLLETVASRLVDVVGDSCGVFLLSDDGRRLSLAALRSRDADVVRDGGGVYADAIELERSATARRVVESGEAHLASSFDTSGEARAFSHDAFVRRRAVRSVLVVALRPHDRSIGILTLARHAPNEIPFDDDDRDLVQSLADQAALAISNAELLRAARRELREHRLHESEESFRRLVGAVKDYAIFMLDPAGLVTSWNAGAERIKGYPEADVLGQHFSRFYPSDDVKAGKPDQALRAAAADGRYEDEGWRVRRDGSRYLASVVINAVRDARGELIGFANVTRDVTERHKTETALKLANRELEAFGYSVAHDLRAPLRGVSGFAQLLLETYHDKLDAEGRDWLEEIHLNAVKMGELIDALLSLSKLSRGEVRAEPIDLSDLARTIAFELAVADPRRSVRLVVADGLRADADPGLARALLLNLLENAWKFTRDAEAPRIEVGETRLADERVFFVRDNGAGFDMAFAGKLFAPFQRLHSVGEFRGTGIGLATCQRIVQRHGGRIWAEARVGEGATFFFTLPGTAREARA
jgi:PAS domain S-box-containing protein